MAAFDFPINPTSGQVFVAPGGSPQYVYDGSKWVTAGFTGGVPTAGYRNAVINGNFDVWQRNLPGAGVNQRFTADRWFVDSIGSTVTPQILTETPGALPGPAEPRWFHGAVVASVAGAGNYAMLATRIEGVRTLAGQQVTLSFTAWADAPKNMAIEAMQLFGTGGSPSANLSIPVGKITLSNATQRYSVTFTMPSITGKTIGTNLNDYIELRFWLDAGSSWNAARRRASGWNVMANKIWANFHGVYLVGMSMRSSSRRQSCIRSEAHHPWREYVGV
jgi:hypothetical protein